MLYCLQGVNAPHSRSTEPAIAGRQSRKGVRHAHPSQSRGARPRQLRLARQPPHLLLRLLLRPRPHGLRASARHQRRPCCWRRGLPRASACRHGDRLVRLGRRARAQGQHRHRIGDPSRRRAAHVGRLRHPPQRVQRVQDRARALPADLDHPREEGVEARATSRSRSRPRTSAASCASSARATDATAR